MIPVHLILTSTHLDLTNKWRVCVKSSKNLPKLIDLASCTTSVSLLLKVKSLIELAYHNLSPRLYFMHA